MREDGSVDLVLRCDASDFQVNHMRATLHFDPARAASLDPVAPPAPVEAPALDPKAVLYGDLFFHRGRFKRVERYRVLRGLGCVAEIDCRDESFFGAFQPQQLMLGDPGARDAAIHAIQACMPHRDLLPVGVESITSGPLGGDAPLLLLARERSRKHDIYTYDLELVDATGTTVERWVGLQLQSIAGASARQRWTAPLLAPRLEEMAWESFASSQLWAALVPGCDRSASERAAAIAAGDGERLQHRPDGKPLLASSRSVSVSHGDAHTLAVVSREPVACDMEAVEPRSSEIWRDLLGTEHERLARLLSESTGEPFDASATRVWGAQECMRKLGLQRETPITLRATRGEEELHLEAGAYAVLSLKTRLRGCEQPVVITLIGKGKRSGADDALL
jgi:enediyne polyketide synthase